MPIYEYECKNCHHAFDVMQKMSDDPIKMCPECSKNTVERLVSATAFQLKGTGWYVTDFKDKGKPSTPKESATSSEKKTESVKSESKSVTKDE